MTLSLSAVKGYFTKSEPAIEEFGKKVLKKTSKVVQTAAQKAEHNTPGRILRMQEAKQAFQPITVPAPYATKVTKESIPTLQVIESMHPRMPKDGFVNRQACADALAAFKHEPRKVGGKLNVDSVPTQQFLDNMLGIPRIENLQRTEAGELVKSVLQRRADVRAAFGAPAPAAKFKDFRIKNLMNNDILNAKKIGPISDLTDFNKITQNLPDGFLKNFLPKFNIKA